MTPKKRKTIMILILTGHALWSVAAVPVIIRCFDDEVAWVVGVATWLAQTSLLAVSLAIGQATQERRWLRVFGGIGSMGLATVFWSQDFRACVPVACCSAIPTLIMVSFIAAPLAWMTVGGRRSWWLILLERGESRLPELRFTIPQLLITTFIAAALLGLGKAAWTNLELLGGFAGFIIGVLSVCLAFIAGPLIAVWAVLLPGRVGWRLLLLLPITLCLCAYPAVCTSRIEMEFAVPWTSIAMLNVLLVTVTLLAYRGCGYRLVRWEELVQLRVPPPNDNHPTYGEPADKSS